MRIALAAMIAFVMLGRPIQDASNDAAQVTALVREYETAIRARDASVHERLFAADYTYTPGNGAFMDRQEHMNFTRSGALVIESFASQDQRVRLYGQTAVVTGMWVTRDARGGGPPRDRRVRYMLVFAKREGRWQIVAEQRTGVAAEQGGEAR